MQASVCTTLHKDTSMSTAVDTKTLKLTDIAFPKKCNVVFLNDDVTPMNFVTELLIGLFNHTSESAGDVMLFIHETGKGVAGTFDPEVAEQKAFEATQLSRANSFPLTVDVEQV